MMNFCTSNNLKPQVLYKQNGTDDTVTLLNIVRYLYTQGYDIRADTIVERNFPTSIKQLPTIILKDTEGTEGTEGNIVLNGLREISNYYESITEIKELCNKGIAFDKLNPDYRITLSYTHKNLVLGKTKN